MACESIGDDLGLQADAPNMHPRSGAPVRREVFGVRELAPRSLGYLRAFAAARPDARFAQDEPAHTPASTTSRCGTSLTTGDAAVGSSAFL